jgi:hypothetical protein
MKTGETKVIAERESGSALGESWPEYLVLKKLKKGQFHLNIMRNETIDDAHTYCSENDLIDDEGNFNLPEQIEGKYVFVNEGYIYTEDLVEAYDNDPGVIFISSDEKIVADWFKENEWDYTDFIEKFSMEERGIVYPVISTIKESDTESIADPLDLLEPLTPEQAKRANELWEKRKAEYASYRNSTSQESTKNSTAKKTTTKKKS